MAALQIKLAKMSENISIGDSGRELLDQFEGIKNKAKELAVWLVDLSTCVGKVMPRWLKEMQHKSYEFNVLCSCSSLRVQFLIFMNSFLPICRTDFRNSVLILGLHLNFSIVRTTDHWVSLHLLTCIVLNLLYKLLLKIVWQKLVPYFVTTSRV